MAFVLKCLRCQRNKSGGDRGGGGNGNDWDGGGSDGETAAAALRESSSYNASSVRVAYDDDDDDEQSEWVAEVEPGVHLTLQPLPCGGGNQLKRIRFDRSKFNKWDAQIWWGNNYDRVNQLYNITQESNQAAYPTPTRSIVETDSQNTYSRRGSLARSSSMVEGGGYEDETAVASSSTSHVSYANTEVERMFVEEVEPGIRITCVKFYGEPLKLRRIRFE
ncbi:hypothetical protein DM860_006440 [Cuscuta australis]|uniref:BRX domain-containing protein n=1 Tax=Cuscuta australis TaxID=267555 RepID=A0A328D5E3_9ASTE|nr:hypothetical protein DM860_006440 [Cuscuta australis]